MILTNGYDANSGIAMKIEINSIVTLSNCLFTNNSAPKTGSAIFVNRTELYANKIETRQNRGIGTPIQGYSSNLSINNALLLGNVNIPYGGGGIYMFESKIKVKNVTSAKNCDVIVAYYGDEYPSPDVTCLQLTKLSSVSAKDPVQCFSSSAPTPSLPTIPSPPSKPLPPVTLPSPTSSSPDHQICFSGNNIVEVQDKGHFLMSQLMIGDFVKLSMSDQFTQVYGFGHLDHHSEGVYLQICFDKNRCNGTEDDVSPPILEIS